MSDNKTLEDKPFRMEIVKQQCRAICKYCKEKFVQNHIRISRTQSNSSSSVKWYHIQCIFKTFQTQRQTTKRIEGPEDVVGWHLLNKEEKKDILKRIKQCNILKTKSTKSNKKQSKLQDQLNFISDDSVSLSSENMVKESKDNSFRTFRKIVSDATWAKDKVEIFKNVFSKGIKGNGFSGDIYLWCKLLLPGIDKRNYRLTTKQLLRIFSKIFNTSVEGKRQVEQCNVDELIYDSFEKNRYINPVKDSSLTIQEVDDLLNTLTTLTKEEEQQKCFEEIISRCTANDLKIIIRLIKHDLRMSAGVKDVLEGLDVDAYLLYKSYKNLKEVIDQCWKTSSSKLTEKNNSSKRKKSSTQNQTKKSKVEEVTSLSVKSENGLIVKDRAPQYFQDVKLLLEDGVKEKFATFVQCVIEYGGVILDLEKNQEATHVLHLEDSVFENTVPCPVTARHIIVQWIKDTVEKKCLQDFRPYSVRLLPQKRLKL